jgi:purine-binding chemotaxis protein CheW
VSESRVAGLTAAGLRQAFDKSFAVPSSRESQEAEDLLLIRLGGDPFAIRLRDIGGLIAKSALVLVPASGKHLLGLAGIRGSIVPVFGLSSLFGYPSTADAARWIVLCASDEPIALGFSDFEGHRRLPSSSIMSDESGRTSREYSPETARMDTGHRPVVDIAAVVASIRKPDALERLAQELAQ